MLSSYQSPLTFSVALSDQDRLPLFAGLANPRESRSASATVTVPSGLSCLRLSTPLLTTAHWSS